MQSFCFRLFWVSQSFVQLILGLSESVLGGFGSGSVFKVCLGLTELFQLISDLAKFVSSYFESRRVCLAEFGSRRLSFVLFWLSQLYLLLIWCLAEFFLVFVGFLQNLFQLMLGLTEFVFADFGISQSFFQIISALSKLFQLISGLTKFRPAYLGVRRDVFFSLC